MVFSFLKMLACDVLVRGHPGDIPRFAMSIWIVCDVYKIPPFGAEHIANRSQSILLCWGSFL